MNLALQLIADYEGLRLTAYKDSLGLWTIGYGHLLTQDRDWTGYTITKDQADIWLQLDCQVALQHAQTFPFFSQMNDVRQAALVSMCYQLGVKPFGWPEFMASLNQQDYAGAAANGLDSLWARQTPARAQEEMSMLATGVIHEPDTV